MIRKAVIGTLFMAAAACGAAWALASVPREGGFDRYSRRSGLTRVWAVANTYLIDLEISETLRVVGGIEEGAFVLALSTPARNANEWKTLEMRQGRFRVWRNIVEDPSICGIGLSRSIPPGTQPVLAYRLVHGLRVPCWATIAILGFYPTVAFIGCRARRWRRRRRGLCVKCGYNLTGNKSGRCPECGELA